jgi:general secretion pathway protein G
VRRRAWSAGVSTVFVLIGATLCLNLVVSQRTDCHNKVPTDVMTLEAACERYAELHAGASPPSLDELVRPDARGAAPLRDTCIPLGRPYRYGPPDREFGFVRIWTFGRDGLPGGEGEDADLGNWTINAQIEAWSDSPASAREE